jgi:hypothetical protein
VSTLPPIDSSMLPADIRTGSKTDKDNYETGLQFERQLVEQLTQQLSDTMGDSTTDQSSSDDSDDGMSAGGGDAASTYYKQMLPGVMADAVMSAGGLGLARTIANNLKEAGK